MVRKGLVRAKCADCVRTARSYKIRVSCDGTWRCDRCNTRRLRDGTIALNARSISRSLPMPLATAQEVCAAKPLLASGVRVVHSTQLGHHLVAARDFSKGDIIASYGGRIVTKGARPNIDQHVYCTRDGTLINGLPFFL